MSRYSFWAVLTPGEPSWLESRARALLMTDWDEEDGHEPPFEVIRGSGLYHAIAGIDPMDAGAEMRIAEELSLQYDEPVYSIERANDPWTVMVFRKGVVEVVERDPETLARSLGCPLPGSDRSPDRPARKSLRTVVLIEGVRAPEVRRGLEEFAGQPLAPGLYHFEETPQGLLLASDTGRLGFAYIKLSERLPHLTMYSVTASPNLDVFFAAMLRGGEGIAEFASPPREFPLMPSVNEIKGESAPEGILAVLGIPTEWFSNE